MKLLQIFVVVSLLALISTACWQYEPDSPSDDSQTTDNASGEAIALDSLTGTVWEGTCDHQNANRLAGKTS